MPALTARSVILSALLGIHPAEAPAGMLVRIAAELELQESAVRVALTRMVAVGDLERRDRAYRLAPRLLERQRRQDAALASAVRAWTGNWRLALVTTGAADSTDRAVLREWLRNEKFGELREGAWIRPDNIEIAPDTTGRLNYLTARPDEPASKLANRLFDLRGWANQAQHLITVSESAASMRERFELAAACMRHLLNDPLLPPELLPAEWPGDSLRTLYELFRADFAAFADTRIDNTVESVG